MPANAFPVATEKDCSLQEMQGTARDAPVRRAVARRTTVSATSMGDDVVQPASALIVRTWIFHKTV